LRTALEDPACFKGASIQNLKSDLYDLKNRVELQVIAERKAARAVLEEVEAKITQLDAFQALPQDKQGLIAQRIRAQKDNIEPTALIPTLRDKANQAQSALLPSLLAEIDSLTIGPTPADDEDDIPPEPAQTYINARDIKVSWPKPYLTDDADVADYLEEMKKNLLVEIHAGKKVIV